MHRRVRQPDARARRMTVFGGRGVAAPWLALVAVSAGAGCLAARGAPGTRRALACMVH